MEAKRFGIHENAFGFLRLLFAMLVIVAHAPEIVDGNRGREILTQIFGTISFGDVAVDGFFIISGFLIASSYLRQPQAKLYLVKRIARIYPAFLVASLACVVVVALLGDGDLARMSLAQWSAAFGRALLLQPPVNDANAFAATSYPSLNGAMWSIEYEFIGYLLILLLGISGKLANVRFVAFAALLCFVIFKIADTPDMAIYFNFFDFPHFDVRILSRLGAMFCSGILLYLARHRLPYRPAYVAAALIGLGVSLCTATTAGIGVAFFGAYLIFAAAFHCDLSLVKTVNNKNDISYGVYLYAWPIAKLLNWHYPSMDITLFILATAALAVIGGAISWFVIEKPAMALLRHRLRARAVMAATL